MTSMRIDTLFFGEGDSRLIFVPKARTRAQTTRLPKPTNTGFRLSSPTATPTTNSPSPATTSPATRPVGCMSFREGSFWVSTKMAEGQICRPVRAQREKLPEAGRWTPGMLLNITYIRQWESDARHMCGRSAATYGSTEEKREDFKDAEKAIKRAADLMVQGTWVATPFAPVCGNGIRALGVCRAKPTDSAGAEPEGDSRRNGIAVMAKMHDGLIPEDECEAFRRSGELSEEAFKMMREWETAFRQPMRGGEGGGEVMYPNGHCRRT